MSLWQAEVPYRSEARDQQYLKTRMRAIATKTSTNCLWTEKHKADKKERLVMMHKIMLILIISMTLAGTTSFMPRPVILVMGFLILFALSVVMRNERRE